jgi:hypothetical protein
MAEPFHSRVMRHYFRLGPRTQVKGLLRGPAFWTWLTDTQIEELFCDEGEITEGMNFWDVEPPVAPRLRMSFLMGYAIACGNYHGKSYRDCQIPGDALTHEPSAAWSRGWRFGMDVRYLVARGKYEETLGIPERNRLGHLVEPMHRQISLVR